jgi:endo-1,4-beta-D-glucanase Y
MLHARSIIVLLLLAAALLAGGCGTDAANSRSAPQPTPKQQAQAAARAFLDRYVDPDGRVVRRDQGGDTVSEGQAYALLAAVAAGDRARFDRVWGWTAANLRRPDGLLSWHWADGKVADPQSAADADLDAAHALALAARRFAQPALAAEAERMAAAVRTAETLDGVVMAGPWAVARGIVNPSYYDPRALAALHLDDVADGTRKVVAALIGSGAAPPDWAQVGPPPRPSGPPSGSGAASYGFDAARVPIRLAASCDARDRELAAGLQGLQQVAPTDHAVFVVARAAQAKAAGDDFEATSLLDEAADLDQRAPTSYGAAWVALGRTLLETDLLGACPARR